MVIYKAVLPVVAFLVGSSALTFQIYVLHPLHLALKNDFK